MTNLVGMDTPLEKKIENFFSLGILKMSQQFFFNFCYGFTQRVCTPRVEVRPIICQLRHLYCSKQTDHVDNA